MGYSVFAPNEIFRDAIAPKVIKVYRSFFRGSAKRQWKSLLHHQLKQEIQCINDSLITV